MAEDLYYNEQDPLPIVKDEEFIDVFVFVKKIWKHRLGIIITTCIFMVLGLAFALMMHRRYTVTTVMLPQMGSSSQSSIGGLAALAGIDLSTLSSGDISPLAYPRIVGSVPYRLELLYTPLHYKNVDTLICRKDYVFNYERNTSFYKVSKYTLGLPRTLKKMLKGKPETVVIENDGASNNDTPFIVITKEEDELLKTIAEEVTLTVDKKEGYLTLKVKGVEPRQTAELALKAQQLLQDEVTRMRTEKAQSELDYIQARYDEIKKEAESLQYSLASLTDRSQNMTTSMSRVERERLQSKYNVANSIYTEMARQLEQAKMKVKQDTPVFTILEPVVVPTKASNSRARTLIMWTLMGFLLSSAFVLFKDLIPLLMSKLSEEEKDESPESEE